MDATQAGQAAITTSKIVVLVDHIRNNRIEYILLLGLGHLVGATAFVSERVSGMCV